MHESNYSTLKLLETQIRIQKELKSINNFGLIQGSIKFFDTESESLRLDDSKDVIESLIRKLVQFFTKNQSKTTSIITIGDNLIPYSKDLNYNQLVVDNILLIRNAWNILQDDLKTLALYNDIEVKNILVTVNRILENGKMVYNTILTLEKIQEHSIDKKIDHIEHDLERSSNLTAINMLKQIKQKLEGRVSPTCVLEVHEQVSVLIREATSKENLALMFEGWTPWI